MLIPQQAYTDVKNKELILFLARKDPDPDSHGQHDTLKSSYLYDIENDKYCQFIENYETHFKILEFK